MKMLLLLIVGIGATMSMTAPAAARNYDCTKAGNANKAVCKTAIAPVPAKASAAPAAVLPSAGVPATAAPKRNYDCAKAGNANKAVCKASASTAATAPIIAGPAAPKPVAAARNYDCTKAGNANKAACKAVASASPDASTSPVASAARAPAAPRAPTAVTLVAPGEGSPAGPAVIAANGARIVPWNTKSGKLVHYDCSKAGNLSKRACKQ